MRHDPEQVGPLPVWAGMPAMDREPAVHVSRLAKLAHVCLMNELADLCEAVGADVEAVRAWLAPCGWLWVPRVSAFVGGPGISRRTIRWCRQLADAGTPHALNLAVATAHQARRPVLLRHVRELLGRRISRCTLGIWGLSYKANTDCCEESAALHMIDVLIGQHPAMRFRIYDPAAMLRARRHFGSQPGIHFAGDPYDAADLADLLVIATEWESFARTDLARVAELLHNRVIVDGRNLFAPTAMRAFGIEYRSLGRPVVERGVPLRDGSGVSQQIARRALGAFGLLIETFLSEVKSFCEKRGADFGAVLRTTAMEPCLRHLAGSPPATAAMRRDAAWLYALGFTHQVPLHILPVLV